jgi:hypothetical protein
MKEAIKTKTEKDKKETGPKTKTEKNTKRSIKEIIQNPSLERNIEIDSLYY